MAQVSDSRVGNTSSGRLGFGGRIRRGRVKSSSRLLALLWISVITFHGFSAQLPIGDLGEADAPKVDTEKIRSILDAYNIALRTIPSPAGLNLQFGVRFWELGAITESQRAFERELAINSGNLRAEVMLAIIKVQQHRYTEAASELQALIKQDPSLTQIWHPLGRALLELGRLEEAKRCLEKATTMEPGVAQSQALLAKVYARLSDTVNAERASALYFEALKLKRAREAAALGQWPAALQFVDDYLASFPLSSDGLYIKAGILFNGFRKLDSAIETVRRSIVQNRSNLEARGLLAALLLAKRDSEGFQQEVIAILQMDPLDSRANYYMGRFEYDRREFKEAREHLERARLVLPSDALIATTLARTCEHLGLSRESEEVYKSGIARSHNGVRDISLYSNFGAFLLRCGRVAESIPYLEAAASSPTVDAEVCYMAGVAHLQNGDLARAKDYLEKAIERRQDYAEAHLTLGTVLQKEGDATGARREIAMGKEERVHATSGSPMDDTTDGVSLPQ